MMVLKNFKKYIVPLWVIFALLSGISKPIHAQQKDSCFKANSASEENVAFYKFVVKKYVDLIKMVYLGDNPFFVVIEHLYNFDEIIDIDITYTTNFYLLKSYINNEYYQYDDSAKIFVVLTEFQGDTTLRNDFAKLFNTKKISEEILKEKLYPLTFEGFVEDLTKGRDENVKIIFNENPKNTNDTFKIRKYYKRIDAYSKSAQVVYFNDFKFD